MRFGVLVSLGLIHEQIALKQRKSSTSGIAATGILFVIQELGHKK